MILAKRITLSSRSWASLVMVLVLTVVSLGMSSAGQDTGPRLTLDPSSGRPGIAVEVGGTGFDGDCGVNLFLDRTDGPSLIFVSVGEEGTFTAELVIPKDTTPGEHDVVGQGLKFEDDEFCGGPSGKEASEIFIVREPFDHNVYMRNRVLGDPGIDQVFLDEIRGARAPVHGLVQLHRLPKPGDVKTIRELGVKLLAYLNGITAPGTAYLASISSNVASEDPRFRKLVRGLQRLVADDKLEPELLSKINSSNPPFKPIRVLVLFFKDVIANEAAAVFTRNGLEARRQGKSKTWKTSASPDQIRALAEEDAVQWIEHGPDPFLPTVDVARMLSNVDQVQQLNIGTGVYAGLSGTGVQIGIMDSGVDHHHNDFAGRIIRMQHGGGNHGTHVAGIAAGSGVQSNRTNDATPPQPNGGTAFQWRGMAPQAGIAAYGQASGNAGIYADAINNLRVDITNHSYVLEVQGLYSSDVVNVDAIVRGDSSGIEPRPVVWAAANNASVGPRDCDGDMMTDGNFPQYPFPNVPPGGACPTGFQAGYFSVLAPCKNCITVASVDNNRRHSSFSGLGPTMDGRLKPDISAMGNPVFATGGDTDAQGNTVPGNDYEFKSGTSMAAPVVTGIIALMLQQFAATFGVNLDAAPPLPSTLKAILAQTAVDLADTDPTINFDTGAATAYGVGPDWATGYGLVNAQEAVRMITNRRFVQGRLSQSDATDEFALPVIAGQTEVRVTLAWDDPAGTPNASATAPQLVNDLDLVLTEPNGTEHRPLVLPVVTPGDCDNDPTNGIQVGTCMGLDPPGQNYFGPAAEGIDNRNNVEQVVVRNPTGLPAGIWTARVSARSLVGAVIRLPRGRTVRLPLGGRQAYSLAGAPAQVLVGTDNSVQFENINQNVNPGAFVTKKVLQLNLAQQAELFIRYDLGQSHGCCDDHFTGALRILLDGNQVVSDSVPFTDLSGIRFLEDFDFFFPSDIVMGLVAPTSQLDPPIRGPRLRNYKSVGTASAGVISAGLHTLELQLGDAGWNSIFEIRATR